MVMKSVIGCLKQMMGIHDHHGGNVIAVEEVPSADVSRHGVVSHLNNSDDVIIIDQIA
jgi:UTP--glucose-1-phosphate uridylyltransferase